MARNPQHIVSRKNKAPKSSPGEDACACHSSPVAVSSYRTNLTPRFFILGCQRSGTTLVRLVLECHPLIQCLDEIEAYKALLISHPTIAPQKKWVGYKIPRWTEQLCEPTLWDDGLDETGPQFYDSDPILFLLRDVRDTVVSMTRLMAGEKSWLEVYGRPILAAKMAKQDFRSRYAREIAFLEKADWPAVSVGALYWKYKTQAFFDYRDRGLPVCGVSYEKLVAHPETHLKRILSHLDLPWDPNLLDHPRFPHTELYPNGRTVGNSDPNRPINTDSVGQWQRSLSRNEVSQIMAIAQDLNERIQAV
jgi:hypothetical protein